MVGRVLLAEKEVWCEGEFEGLGSHAIWRNCVQDVHEEGGQEEVGGKSSSSGIG